MAGSGSVTVVDDIQEAESSEETGLFYKYIGSIDSGAALLGNGTGLQVAGTSGVLVCRQENGIAVVRASDATAAVLQARDDGLDSAAFPSPAALLQHSPSASLHLSSSCALLAVAEHRTVSVYSTAALLDGTPGPPPCRIDFPEEVELFAFRPGTPLGYACLLRQGSTWQGMVGAKPERLAFNLPGPVTCLAWSPSGRYLALGAADTLTLVEPGTGTTLRTLRLSSIEVQAEVTAIELESLAWLQPNRILVESRLLQGSEAQPVAPLGLLRWEGELPDANSAQFSEFFALNVLPDRTAGGLRLAKVPGWGATIYSHAAAADDHIKVLLLEDSGDPVAADITDDRLAIRLPNAPDDGDNFVTGLGVDLTAGVQVEVSHPTDPEAGDLGPQPLLWVATSDGMLRAYTFGSTEGRPSVVLSVAQPLERLALPATSGGTRELGQDSGLGLGAPPSAAAAATVPLGDESDDDDLEEEEEEGSEAAAGSEKEGSGPDEDDQDSGASNSEREGSFELVSEPGENRPKLGGAPQAAPPAPVPAPGVPAAGSSASSGGGQAGTRPSEPLPSTSSGSGGSRPAAAGNGAGGHSPPGFVAGAPGTGTDAPPPSPPLFAFAGGPGVAGAPSPGIFGSMPSTPSIFGKVPQTPSIFGQPAATQPAGSPFPFAAPAAETVSSLRPAAGKATTSATAPAPAVAGPKPQPPLPSASQVKAAAALRAKALGVPEPRQGAGAATSTAGGKQGGATFAPVARSSSGAPPAPPALSGSKAGAVRSDAAQGSQPQAPAPAQRGPAVPPDAAPRPPPRLGAENPAAARIEADFLDSLHETRRLEVEVHAAVKKAVNEMERGPTARVTAGVEAARRGLEAARAALSSQAAQAEQLADAVKDCMRKTAAMPRFLPADGAGADEAPAWPLDPVLAAAKCQLQAQLLAARVKLAELGAALTELEDRQRSVRAGEAMFDPVKPQQVLDIFNAQMEIIVRRSEELEGLKRDAQVLGILDMDSPRGDDDGTHGVAELMSGLHIPGTPPSTRASPWKLVGEASPSLASLSISPVPARGALAGSQRKGLVPASPASDVYQRILRLASGPASGGLRVTDVGQGIAGGTDSKGRAAPGAPPSLQAPVPLPSPPRLSPPAGTPSPRFDFSGQKPGAAPAPGGAALFGSRSPGGLAGDLKLSAMPSQAPAQKQAAPQPAGQGPSLKPPAAGKAAQLPAAATTRIPFAPAPTTSRLVSASQTTPALAMQAKPAPNSKPASTVPAKPATAPKPVAKGQPPLPSMVQVAGAKELLAKVTGTKPAGPPGSRAGPPGGVSASKPAAGLSREPSVGVGTADATLGAASLMGLSLGSGAGPSNKTEAPGTPSQAQTLPSTVTDGNQAGGLGKAGSSTTSLFGAATSAAASKPAAASSTFGAFGAAALATAPQSATATSSFGAFGAAMPAAASKPDAATSSLGAFGSAPASSTAASLPFTSMGAGAFGGSSSSQTAMSFGGFGAASALGASEPATSGSAAVAATAAASSAASTLPFGAFGASTFAPAPSTGAASAFGAFGTPAAPGFASSFGAFGAASSTASTGASPAPAFGAFGAPAAGAAAPSQPFGAAAASTARSSPATAFGAFGGGQPATASPFGAFRGGGPGAAAPASPAPAFGGSAGLGQPTSAAFGQSAGLGGSTFGQGSGFGAPASPGFGAPASPATPGFGQPGFGAGAGKATAFGQPTGGFGAFSGAGSSPAASGFGGFGAAAAGSAPAASGVGGFGAAAASSFPAASGFGGFGAASPRPPAPSGASLWAPRK
ncbi:NUP214 [Auxenochlorella protothecoides x Auxenochlorella symbiontica]